MKGLAGKRVLITGGASGIGLATVDRFWAESSEVCVVDMPSWEASELGKKYSQRLTYIQGDITKQETLDKIDQWMQKGIDVVINNAGITKDATIGKMTDEQFDQVIAVNLKAVFKISQLAAKYMKEKNFGVILNAASVVAHYGNFGQVNYVATKAGVIGMTKTLAKELGKNQVRVNAVAPGFIGTPMVKAMPEKVITMMEEKVPLKRLGTPEEIAATYAFLASDDAKYITGTCINVDGGIVL